MLVPRRKMLPSGCICRGDSLEHFEEDEHELVACYVLLEEDECHRSRNRMDVKLKILVGNLWLGLDKKCLYISIRKASWFWILSGLPQHHIVFLQNCNCPKEESLKLVTRRRSLAVYVVRHNNYITNIAQHPCSGLVVCLISSTCSSDYGRNNTTALALGSFTSTKLRRQNDACLLQLQNVLLSDKLAHVKALKSGDPIVQDNQYVIPHTWKINMEIDINLLEAGATSSRDFANQKNKHNDNYFHKELSNWSSDIRLVMSFVKSRGALLIATVLLAAITYQLPFHLPASKSTNQKTGTIQMGKLDSMMSSSLILLNSLLFIASAFMTIFLLHDFPMKPLPQISMLSLFGSYMCSIKAVSPKEGLILFSISIFVLLLAAARKIYGIGRVLQGLGSEKRRSIAI